MIESPFQYSKNKQQNWTKQNWKWKKPYWNWNLIGCRLTRHWNIFKISAQHFHTIKSCVITIVITLNLSLDANNFVPYWTQLALPPPSKRRFATPIPFIIVYAPQSKSISRGIITINLKAIVRILLFLKHKVTVATYINPILLGGRILSYTQNLFQ